MELIDREAVREFIKSYRHSTDVAFHMEDHLDEIPAAPRWVMCEEEPKEDGDYLTYYVDGYCAVNHWSKGWGWMYDEEAVRYWMPIEPPKEGL